MKELDTLHIARKYWLDNNLDEYDYVLLLPGNDEAVNKCLTATFEATLCGVAGISVCGEPARQLTTLYSLYRFSGGVLVGSFDLPHGRKLCNLIDSGIATEDELINDVILGAINGTEA